MRRIWISTLLIALWSPYGLLAAAQTQPSSRSAQADPSSQSASPAQPMVVRYHYRGAIHARHAYKFALIRKILETTRQEFGDYQLVPLTREVTAKRQALLVSEGKQLNLVWASPGTPMAKSGVITIPIDILKGMLGHRVCIINKEAKPFEVPHNIEALRHIKIGQGLNWVDVDIYKNNQIVPEEATTFTGLFDMLAFKRYACIPLGADEIVGIYRDKKGKYPFLGIEPNLLIYYDFPLYLHVSNKFPKLAQRIQQGLEKLKNNGEFEALFLEYHQKDLSLLNLNQRKIICLASPFLPSEGQCHKFKTSL